MTWDALLNTLDNMTYHAKEAQLNDISLLEKDIIQLGQISRNLSEAEPPDQAMFIRLHAAVNRLTAVLPNEKNTIRQKITGMIKRSHAQQAYNKMQQK